MGKEAMSKKKPLKNNCKDEMKTGAVSEQALPGTQSVVANSLLFDNLLFKYFLESKKENILRANDSSKVFITKSNGLHPHNFASYPNSPTAQRYLKAYQQFSLGWLLLRSYEKDTVQTEEDCDHLKRAFHCYSFGHISEQHLVFQFPPVGNFSKLINEYLKMRPNDILSEFCYVANKFHPSFRSVNTISGMDINTANHETDYEFQKQAFITIEKLIHKIESFESISENDKLMLFYLNFINGASYVTTRQNRRALDSFEKCLSLDPSNVLGLYSVAYQYMERDPEKAICLFKEYIKMAPECDTKFPNAHYMISSVYMKLGNMREAIRYYRLGDEAESKRLDFLGPTDAPQKELMELLATMIQTDRRSISSQ